MNTVAWIISSYVGEFCKRLRTIVGLDYWCVVCGLIKLFYRKEVLGGIVMPPQTIILSYSGTSNITWQVCYHFLIFLKARNNTIRNRTVINSSKQVCWNMKCVLGHDTQSFAEATVRF